MRQASPLRPNPSSRQSGETSRRILAQDGLIACLILFSIGLVFWRVIRNEFVAWDDDINVTENPLLNPATTQGIIQFWKAPYLRLYIPLTYTLWGYIAKYCQIRGSAPFSLPALPFHLANFLVHLAAGLAAFGLLRRILRNLPAQGSSEQEILRYEWAAGVGAVFFAIHPIQVEPVSWVSGFRDVLSGLGALLAIDQYLAFSRSQGKGAAIHYISATAALAMALLSKPSAIVIPVMVFILEFGLFSRPIKKMILPLGVWMLISGLFAVLTQVSQGATHIRAEVPLWERPLIAADALAFYLYKLVFPMHLSPDYGRAPDVVIEKGWLRYTWLAPVAMAFLIRWLKDNRIYWAGLGLFVVGVLPVLGLVPFLHQDLSTVADRYLYLSMIGPSLVLAWVLARSEKWKREIWIAGSALVVLLAVRSGLQAEIWANTGTLFGHIVALNPDSGVAHLNLGNYLMNHGKEDQARSHFLETLRLRPGDGLALNNLGNLSFRQGKLDEAASYYAEGLKNQVPDNIAGAHAGMGMVLVRQGKIDPAIAQYEAALKINPRRADIHHALAALLQSKGRWDEALAHERWALEIRPDLKEIHKNIGILLAQMGRMEEAQQQFAQGLGASADSLEPFAAICDTLQVHNDFDKAALCYKEVVRRAPGMAEGHNSLGYVLERQGHAGEALAQYREAARLKPSYQQAQFNLGRALLSSGKLDEAVTALSLAVKSIPGAVEIRHNLGVALMQRGDKQGAIRAFKEVLALNPNFTPSKNALAQLGIH